MANSDDMDLRFDDAEAAKQWLDSLTLVADPVETVHVRVSFASALPEPDPEPESDPADDPAEADLAPDEEYILEDWPSLGTRGGDDDPDPDAAHGRTDVHTPDPDPPGDEYDAVPDARPVDGRFLDASDVNPDHVVETDDGYACAECDRGFDTAVSTQRHYWAVHSTPHTDGEWLHAGDDEDQSGSNVRLRSVRRGTAAHEVLTIIARGATPAADEGVPSNGIQERVVDAAPSNVSSATLQLYRSLLVDRRKTNATNVASGFQYAYRPTTHGLAELDRLGPYEPGDAHTIIATGDGLDDISPNTCAHAILSTLAAAGAVPLDGVFIPAEWLKANTPDYGENAVSPTLSKLEPSSFTERRDRGEVHRHYEYRLTNAGLAALTEVGLYQPEDDAYVLTDDTPSAISLDHDVPTTDDDADN